MEVRRLVETDTDKLYSLRLKALESVPTAFGMSVEDELLRGKSFFQAILSSTTEDSMIYGAFEQEALIAMVGLMRTPRSKTRHKASIWGMYVDKAHRAKGIGSKLMESIT